MSRLYWCEVGMNIARELARYTYHSLLENVLTLQQF